MVFLSLIRLLSRSAGLKSAGSPSGTCGESDGQVYAREKEYDGKYAIMYAWYMPKDNALHGGGWGHTHDWESVVVWLSDDSVDAEYLGIAYSSHGDFSVTSADHTPDDAFEDSRPFIEYYASGSTHSVRLSTTKGGEQPLIDWDAMTEEAQNALTDTDWGSAVCPFIDGNLKKHMEKALL